MTDNKIQVTENKKDVGYTGEKDDNAGKSLKILKSARGKKSRSQRETKKKYRR